MSRKFNVTIDLGWCDADVYGYFTEGARASKRGHPDDWTPEEPHELDVSHVLIGGKDVYVDELAFQLEFEEKIIEAILEK